MEINKNTIKDRTEEVIKKSAIGSNLNDFLITHVPFKELKYCPSGVDDNITEKYSEEQLFNEYILSNRHKHNFLIVQGSNGSGKSHFIRWLKYKYDTDLKDDSEISILIERNYNTLQGTIEQLLNNEIIKEFVSKDQLDKLNEAGRNIATDKFLTIMNFTFVTEIMREEDDECILNNSKRKRLASFLSSRLVIDELMIKDNGPIKRIAQKLSTDSTKNKVINDDIRFKEEDFTPYLSDLLKKLRDDGAEKYALDFVDDFDDNKRNFRKNVVDYLNSKLDDVIQSVIKLNSQDLNNMLFNIRTELNKAGKTLTLFIEDITSFTGIDRAMIENLIIEHTLENKLCRLFSVVGITEAYYRDNLPDNLKDRVTARIVIDKDSIFGDESAILDVAARYINAIYLDKDDIKKWVDRGAVESELPIVKQKTNWSTYTDREGRIFNIYPFTKQAIVNLYNQLIVKTPRMVISNIISPIFLKYTSEVDEFPQGINVMEGIISIPKFKDNFTDLKINDQLKGKERDRFKSLIRIWGDATINVYNNGKVKYLGGIEEEIFKEFNIPMLNGNNVNVDVNKKAEQNNLTNSVENKDKAVPLVSTTVKTTVTESVVRNVEYDNIIQDLNSWYNKETPLKSHSRIRDYIVSFLNESIYWEMEDISPLVVSTTISKNIVTIEDQNARSLAEDSCIYFKRSEENYYFFMALVDYNLLGKKKWNFEGASDRIILLSVWNENNKDKIIDSIKKMNGDRFDVYSYGLINNYYLNTICSNELNKEQDPYKGLLINNINIDSENAKKILGYDIAKLSQYKEDIQDNKELVLRYYNCKLGDADSTKTKSFYLDAGKILTKIEELQTNEWKIKNNETVEKLNGASLSIYNLYVNFIKKDLNNIVNEKVAVILKNIKEFRDIVGYDEQYKQTMLAIKEFYMTLVSANIFYNQVTYSTFEEELLKKPNINDILKDLETINNNSLKNKIILLGKNYFVITTKCTQVIKDIEKVVNNQYNSKKSSNNYSEVKNQLNITKNKVFTALDLVIKEVEEVNGGDIDAIK